MTTYYLLRKTEIPTVIVECGFLSNTEEAEKLMKEVYQEKIAQAICEGVQKFLHTARRKTSIALPFCKWYT